MTRPASLRWSVLLGALLWTVGLFVLAGVIATWFVFTYPNGPRILHTPFRQVTLSLVIAGASMAAGFYYVRHGLSSMARLRDAVARVRSAREPRVTGTFPSEVMPLVDDLNALLEHQDAAVRRAHARAADLAHGLKTSLAVVAHEAERAGTAERGDVLRAQVDRMQRQIDYHLAHARAAASGATPGTSCEVAPAAEALVRTLERLHAARGITIRSHVGPGTAVRVQREDLEEMLGNLLDNACKWARSTVAISAAARAGRVELEVDDDGPGVPVAMRASVLQRGVRADQAAPGSGLGLAIVADLADLHGGAIALETSPLGGTRARLTLLEAPRVA